MEILKQESSDLSTNMSDEERIAIKRQSLIDQLYQKPIHRAHVIEEVAQHIEKMKGFGQDTISSIAIYIRSLK